MTILITMKKTQFSHEIKMAKQMVNFQFCQIFDIKGITYAEIKVKLKQVVCNQQIIKIQINKINRLVHTQQVKTMSENPESGMITPRTMFQYDNHTNIPWNDVQYNPVRQYLDPTQMVNQRKWANQQKGQKDTRYLTRKGFYMDYHIKVVKGLPAPPTYNLKDPWDQTHNKKQGHNRKIDSKLMKYSYLDRIQMEQKNRKTPAPGSYDLNKTDKQIKQDLQKMKTKKVHHGPKRYFYQDTQYLSNVHPGAGSQNPHLSVDHLKMNKTDHKFWIGKHKKESQYWHKKRMSVPGPMSYSPCHVQFNSFIKIAAQEKNRKKKQSKNGFGSDAKFTYDRPNKKKIIEVRPAPSAYRMEIQWKGKDMDYKKNNWIRSRSTGFSQSVYN